MSQANDRSSGKSDKGNDLSVSEDDVFTIQRASGFMRASDEVLVKADTLQEAELMIARLLRENAELKREAEKPTSQHVASDEQVEELNRQIMYLNTELEMEARYSLRGNPIFMDPIDTQYRAVPAPKVDRFLIIQLPDASIRLIACSLPSSLGETLRLGQEGVFRLEITYVMGFNAPCYQMSFYSDYAPDSLTMPVTEFRAMLDNPKVGFEIAVPGTDFGVHLWSHSDRFRALYEAMKHISRGQKAAKAASKSVQALEASTTSEPPAAPVKMPSSRPPAPPSAALSGQPKAKPAGTPDPSEVQVDLELTAAAERVKTGPHPAANSVS